ncbi:MAG: hypothetical protein ACLFXM_06045 [Acidimicrobiia bacterium]
MSIWTPSGEHPVDRPGSPAGERRAPGGESGAGPPPRASGRAPEDISPEDISPEDLSPEEREQLEAYARQVDEARTRLLEAPAGPVVGQQALQFYELAALHLSQPAPRLADARVAIDALAAVVDALGSRLGETHEPLKQALHQLRLAYVEKSGSATQGGDRPTDAPGAAGAGGPADSGPGETPAADPGDDTT